MGPEASSVLGISESTENKHVLEVFAVLCVEARTAASLRALRALSRPRG